MNILTLYTSGTRQQRFYIKPEDSGVYMKKLNLEIDGDLTVSGTTRLNVSNVVTNLVSTGDIIARNLVYNIGNQTISGIKTFSEGVFGSNLVYNTGNQTISGIKTFANDINASGTGTFAGLNLENINSLLLSGMRITITGNSTIDVANAIRISGNPVLTGIDLSSYATAANLAQTGTSLTNSINLLSGTLTSNYATITNLASTGSTLDTKINSLSGVSVLTFGNQLISGTKTFTSRPTVNGTGVLLSGEAAQVDLTSTVRTTGDQTVSGIKNFQSIPEVSGRDIYYQKDVHYFTGNNFTPDSNLARTFEYILTGAAGASATLNAPINMFDGENIVIKIKQSPSGSNNMQFSASYKFPGSVVPSLTFTAGKADIYTVLKVGTGFYSTYVKDFID